MKFKSFCLIMVCFFSNTCYAYNDGNELLDCCRKLLSPRESIVSVDDHAKVIMCNSYIEGCLDMHIAYYSVHGDGVSLFNIPGNTNRKDIIKAVVKFIEENPSILNEHRSYVVFSALMSTFPPNPKN